MSVNAMQRLSIPKKENYCSRNCLLKNISSIDHSKCKYKFENLNSKLPPLNNSVKKFLAPIPTSKSTTFEKKYKSVLAQREAEYDKNLKSIKVKLFSSTNSVSSLRTSNYAEKTEGIRTNRLSISQNLLFTRRERSRTKGRSSSHKSFTSENSRIIERSEDSNKLSIFTEETNKNFGNNLLIENNHKNSVENLNYQNFMKKETEVDLNVLIEENIKKSEMDLLNDNDDSKMLDFYINEDLMFKQNSCENKFQTQEKEKKEDFLLAKQSTLVDSSKNLFQKIKISPSEKQINPLVHSLEYFQDKIKKINLGIFTLNYENLKTNKENKANFSKNNYRKLLSTFLRYEYGKSIIEEFHSQDEVNDKFLERHMITERMRMKMIDWMIEVLTNYNCEENTYFVAVNILDRYFKKTPEILKPEDLHILGVCSMFISSKFYDVYPLKLKLVVEKVGHNKFSPEEIKLTEEKIIKVLDYQILKPTSYDFVNHFYEEIFFSVENNFMIQEDSLSNYLETFFSTYKLKFDFNYEKFRGGRKFNQIVLNLLMNVVIYLAKMNLHDYSLIGTKASLLAAASIFVGIKICEQINNEEYINDYITKKICEVSNCLEYDLIHCAQKILHNAQNFETIFTGLENLKKVHLNYILCFKESN